MLLLGTVLVITVKMLFYPSFDSQNWKDNPNTRSKYVHSLMNSRIVKGLIYTEVLNVLGRPDIIRNDSISGSDMTLYDPNQSILEYLTGAMSLIDYERVQIHMKNNKAIKVSLSYN